MTRNGIRATAVIYGVIAIGSVSAIASNSPSVTCESLESNDFSTIQDAPTQVMGAQVVHASDDVPAHCLTEGYITPNVGFELQLPTSDWNGKFVEIGCGGFCGTTRVKGNLALGWCDEMLRRGYACITSDQGHSSTKEGYGKSTTTDALWAYKNLQAEIDYGFRAIHVAALAGKAIARHFYGAAPKFSYFMGCSGGGRQALVAAQRFPWDFDGIIAIDPALNLTGVAVALHWNASAVTDKDGKSLFATADIELLHNAVIAQCDLDDGVKDDVIGDPRTCKLDLAQLVCSKARKSGCLSQEQVVAARKVYSGPVTSDGERIFVGRTMPGGEKGPLGFSVDPAFSPAFFRYMAFVPDAGPSWDPRSFDFDSDYKRLGMMEMLYASNNPDLRQFKAAGGKLIIAQGWDDSGSPLPLNTIDYFETVERAMGGRADTQKFARLFMIPGRGHCAGGDGANAIDFLEYLQAWVEQARAPDMMMSAHIESNRLTDYDWADFVRAPTRPVKFTRPVYPYPLQARYKGIGDPNDYRNFKPVEPTSQWGESATGGAMKE